MSNRALPNPYECLKEHLAPSSLFDHCRGCLFLSISYFFTFRLPMTISVFHSWCYWLMVSVSLTILHRDHDRCALNFEKEAQVGFNFYNQPSFFLENLENEVLSFAFKMCSTMPLDNILKCAVITFENFQ